MHSYKKILIALLIGATITTVQSHEEQKNDAAHVVPQTAAPSLDQWLTQVQQNVHKKVLSNGLAVLFYRLPITKEVHLSVSCDVGSRDEKEGQYGLAHMVEHMLFKGNDIMAEIDYRRIAEKFGNVENNASTSWDQTRYYFVTDNKNWPIFSNILAHSMAHARFDEQHFASEVKAVINELNMRRASGWLKVLETMVANAFPSHHPYHHSVGGRKEDLLNASATDLKAFYHKHYSPNNTVIIGVGDIEPHVFFSQIEKDFGSIPASKNTTAKLFDPRVFISADAEQKTVTLTTPQVTTPSCNLFWKIPGLKNSEIEVAYYTSYILQERLRGLDEAQHIVHSYDVNAFGFNEEGFFLIRVEPNIEETKNAIGAQPVVQHCYAIIESAIQNLIHYGPTKEELNAYRASGRNSFISSFEHIKALSSLLGQYCWHKNEYEFIERFKQSQAITGPDIQVFCKKYLHPLATNTILCIPSSKEETIRWQERQEAMHHYEQELLAKKERTNSVEETSLLETLPEPKTLDFSFKAPDEHFVLSNGIDVYIKQRTHTPFVLMRIGIKENEFIQMLVGTEQPYALGFLPCLLPEGTKGTKQHPHDFTKKEHDDFFNALGVSYNFTASGGFMQSLSQDFNAAAEQFLHIMRYPTFPAERYRQAILDEQQSLTIAQDSIHSVANDILSTYLYSKYPWVHSIKERAELLGQLKRQNLIDIHKKYTQPKQLYIVIVGNTDKAIMQPALEKLTKDWAHSNDEQFDAEKQVSIPTLHNPAAKDANTFLNKERVALVAGRLSTKNGTHDSYALTILHDYLNRALFDVREQTGLFYYCHGNLITDSFHTIDQASITTELSLKNVSSAKAAIKEVLATLARDGITEQYLAMAKQNYALKLAKAFSTNSDFIGTYHRLISNKKSFDYYDTKIAAINTLTLDEVNAVAKHYLDPSTWTFITAGRLDTHATT